ncbi:MAG: ABC transporter permease [Bryobacteraceae bacterium]|nr:ABC transporter permease [Bryobacteraceae bacterium]
MRALDKKLLRDLWHMKGQALAIALVIASGVATFIMSRSTLDSLTTTQARFYEEYYFADVFATLKRAPESLRTRIEEIPGVRFVQTRVVAPANLSLENYPDPATALIVSIPDHGQPLLNRLYLRSGRLPDASRDDEVVIGDAFAEAHKFRPGDRLFATINGRRRGLRIVGVALSPEFVYQLAPGSIIPDFESYGIFWMARTPLATAFDMEGAFNDVSLGLSAGAKREDVIDRLDALLRRYGGQGALGRKDQMSNRYLSEEFRQLENMATMFPAIFLGVAAFLLNVVVTRLIATQRDQVAILKAFGYSTAYVVRHYLKLIVLVVALGAAGGIVFGAWLGQGMSRMYMDFYRFPFLEYILRPPVAMTAVLISAAAAMLGTVYSVIRAAGLPPAEAMQPPAPPRYRESVLEKIVFARRLTQPTRMIVRNLERRPLKAFLAMLGIAFSCAILVMGGFFGDSVDYMVNLQFKLAQRDDIAIAFIEPTSERALYSLRSLPGVEYAEGYRSVPAELRFQHRSYRTSIQGLPPDSDLNRLFDDRLRRVTLPPDGLVLTDYLANYLGARPGDLITVEVLEGGRPVRQAPLSGTVREFVGLSAYMQLAALNRLMREGNAISGAWLETDSRYEEAIYRELKEIPRIAGVTVKRKALESFYETMARQMLTFAFFSTLLASTIAFGVVYNTARIALSERSRELASLRVLGFTRGEISYILLGELAILTLAALPLGFLVGWALCANMVASFQTDLYRFPLILEPASYAYAATAVLVSALISGLIVRRRLDHLDLVAVLKTRE